MVIIAFNILGINEIIAYALAAIIGIPVTFILLKDFTFKRSDK